MPPGNQLSRVLSELAAPLVVCELFDLVPDTVFFLKDREGRYLVVNTTLVKRCGRSNKTELLGRTVGELFPSELAVKYAEQDRAVLETGAPITGKLELQLYPDHRPGWCLTTKLPLRDRAGQLIGLAGISRDIQVTGSPDVIPRSLAGVIDHIKRNYAEPLSVAALARRANLPQPRFCRLIKKIFQLTPNQVIVQTRLEAAARRLFETSESVAEIAHGCGFYDHSTFSRHFKATTGLTPLAYRRSLRE